MEELELFFRAPNILNFIISNALDLGPFIRIVNKLSPLICCVFWGVALGIEKNTDTRFVSSYRRICNTRDDGGRTVGSIFCSFDSFPTSTRTSMNSIVFSLQTKLINT